MYRHHTPSMMQIGLQAAPATRNLLIATGAVFVLQLLFDWITDPLSLSLVGLQSLKVWQLVTYLFVHGSVWHIFINMLMLAMFGREVEQYLGTRRFLALYFGSGIMAGLGWLLVSARPWSSCLGASGAVFGVMAAFAALYPRRRITLLVFFVLPVTMTARVMALTLGALTLLLLWRGDGNIAHAAHLVGGIAGYLYVRFFVRGGRRGGGWGHPLEDARARQRRSRMYVARGEEGEAPSRAEIDRILDKISDRGLGSLTRAERDALKRASQARDGSTDGA